LTEYEKNDLKEGKAGFHRKHGQLQGREIFRVRQTRFGNRPSPILQDARRVYGASRI
jgi:hypothetical protein